MGKRKWGQVGKKVMGGKVVGEEGAIRIYSGNGKGKTTAAFGQALRFIENGKRVCVIQFLKGRQYGEYLAARKMLKGKLDVHLAGLDSFVMRGNPSPVDIELAQAGLVLAQRVGNRGYALLILDEINVALDFGLIEKDALISFLRSKPSSLAITLTGRYAAHDIIALADSVTEIKEGRHHYQKGIKEKAGMEF